MVGFFGPRLEKGCPVQRKDTGQHGTYTGDSFGDYVAVKWDAGGSSWVRFAMLRLVEVDRI